MTITRELLIALAIYNAGIDRSKRAYHRDITDEQRDLARAKAVRKAQAQQRYRNRQKEARP